MPRACVRVRAGGGVVLGERQDLLLVLGAHRTERHFVGTRVERALLCEQIEPRGEKLGPSSLERGDLLTQIDPFIEQSTAQNEGFLDFLERGAERGRVSKIEQSFE
ncbi:hypothetical protein [Microbacterium sp.]|uniref:hypothetical protein n=1 Tax=Microbacterium sp. TaxID=51671 RepID=UPI003A8FD5D5